MKRLAVTLFVIVAGGASPVTAQDRHARSPRTVPEAFSGVSQGRDAQRILNSFADCAIARYRPLVEQFLAEIPFSRGAAFRVRRLKATRCNASLHLFADDQLLRGALYEAMFLVDFRERAVADLRDAAAIDYGAGAIETGSDEARMHMALRRFSECVVRSDAAAVRALLLSEVGTPRESVAFGAVGPRLNDCVVAGQQVRFSRPILRGFLAEALYRLSAIRAGGPAPGTTS